MANNTQLKNSRRNNPIIIDKPQSCILALRFFYFINIQAVSTKHTQLTDIKKVYIRDSLRISLEGPMADDNKARYSDEELEEFRLLIQDKIDKAEKDLHLLREQFANDQGNGTDDTSPIFKSFEEGSETMSKEANAQLAARQEKFIRDLKAALVRIENKTYGICRVTGKLISRDRLRLVPHATLSIEAKMKQS